MKLLKNISFFFLVTAGLFFINCTGKTNQQDLVVKIAAGEISGSFNDNVYAFKGIPYAKAERFMPPQDPDAWEGVLECKEFGPVARQIVPWYPDSIQDEKQLFSLNVWTQVERR